VFLDRFLRGLGINPKQFWLLAGLFEKLSDRREIMTQLGRSGVALKKAAWMYFVLIGIGSLLFAGARPTAGTYFWGFMFVTAFILFGVLLSETGNSLVNPTEGLVLAHQPINGATYTAAKLTHLLRILLYFVPGTSGVPALAGLLIKGTSWWYPLLHITAAFTVGLLVALLCCAIFGVLIRIVPVARLKAVGQITEMVPLLLMVTIPRIGPAARGIPLPAWVTAPPPYAVPILIAVGALTAIGSVIFGLRSLSGDFLIRVSDIVHTGSGSRAKVRRSGMSDAVAFLFGGPGSRAGFEYLSRMLSRDWQYRRQFLGMIPALIAPLVWLFQDSGISPFSGQFSSTHVLPHLFGFILFWMCTLLPFSEHYKGAWVFLLAPSRAFEGVARGVFAWMWLKLIVLPHAILFLVFAWRWGAALDSALFTAFSLAVASVYLGLEMRTIEGMPFTQQPVASRGSHVFPILMLSGVVIGTAVALQYYVLFHSRTTVAIAVAVLGVAAYFVTRGALDTFEVSIRHHLGLLSEESTAVYKEIEV